MQCGCKILSMTNKQSTDNHTCRKENTKDFTWFDKSPTSTGQRKISFKCTIMRYVITSYNIFITPCVLAPKNSLYNY